MRNIFFEMMKTSKILFEKFNIDAKPGHKVECPYCHHKTFSIKRDDTIGKCFHPQCGRFITPQYTKENNIYSVFKEIYYDFHLALLMQKDQDKFNAYSYLVKERLIHPQVVEDSMLGVVPEVYDINAKFEHLIKEAESNKVKETELIKTQKIKNTRKKCLLKQNEGQEKNLEVIIDIKDKLMKCLMGTEGWLCFFYTNKFHNIVAIRFRKPYTKENILYFKPFKNISGLFGHELFSPYEQEYLNSLNDKLIVVEGEFNQLQLQSLLIRVAENEGKNPSYIFACAVGCVNNTDFNTIQNISKSPIICYDNDENGAGFSLIKNAKEHMHLNAFTTPGKDSDLDSYIRSFGSDDISAWKAFGDIVGKRQYYPLDFETVAERIYGIRLNKHEKSEESLKEFEINSEVSTVIIQDLNERGQFYNNSIQPYVFLKSEKKLIEICNDNIQCQILLSNYGLNSTETIYKYVIKELTVEAFKNGKKTEIYRLSYFNSENYNLYLFNFDNQIYRISPDSIGLVDNGTDGILFISDNSIQPFEICKIDDKVSLLAEIIIDKINFTNDFLNPEEKKIIIALWLYSLFFEKIMPTKPILAFIGEKGSGKSITLRKIGMLLFGQKFNVTPLSEESKDFDAAVANSSFVALDNADTHCPWLNDKLAIAATGGSLKLRQLYTTNNLIEIPVHCFIGITSRTPSFKRDDVAERLIIMNVEAYPEKKPEKALLDEVINNRNQIMSEVVYGLQEIVRALREKKEVNYSGKFRMADFADFAIKVAHIAGIENKVEEIFEKLSNEQSNFLFQDNPVFELLCEWAKENSDKEVTNTELCKELSILAEKKKINIPYKDNTKSFAQYMRNIRSNLSGFFEITGRKVGGNKTVYKYKLKNEKL